MKSVDLQEFLHRNKLKSVDLVRFWGVTKGTVSQFLNGSAKLPPKRVQQLVNNPYGWDVSMLTQSGTPAEENPSTDSTLIAELRSQIEKLEAKVDYLNQELGEKNAFIKMMSQGGSGIVQVAGGSSCADVG
jgi:hypothetical protein